MTDRAQTRLKLPEALAAFNCTAVFTSTSQGRSFRHEHGPFAGRGYFQDLAMTRHARRGLMSPNLKARPLRDSDVNGTTTVDRRISPCAGIAVPPISTPLSRMRHILTLVPKNQRDRRASTMKLPIILFKRSEAFYISPDHAYVGMKQANTVPVVPPETLSKRVARNNVNFGFCSCIHRQANMAVSYGSENRWTSRRSLK
jgi:hypothetical protein